MIKNTPFKISGDGLSIEGKWFANSRQDIQNWLAGKDDEWLALEETFNAETLAHDNYIDITTYDARLAQYEIDIVAYTDWDGEGDKPEEPIFPVKPKGYYTADEADASVILQMEWQTLKDAFVPDEFGGEFNTPKPEILFMPAELTEPTITPLPAPIPNVPEDEFSVEEIESKRMSDITAEATRVIEAEFSPLKQRKLLSIAIMLLDKRGQAPLLLEEEAMLQDVRDTNTWIAGIRVKENEAQINGTLLKDIIF